MIRSYLAYQIIKLNWKWSWIWKTRRNIINWSAGIGNQIVGVWVYHRLLYLIFPLKNMQALSLIKMLYNIHHIILILWVENDF